MELMDFGFPQLSLYISTCIAVVAVGKKKDVLFVAYTPVRLWTADDEQDWQPHPVDSYSAISDDDDHTYILLVKFMFSR